MVSNHSLSYLRKNIMRIFSNLIDTDIQKSERIINTYFFAGKGKLLELAL